MLFNHLSKSHLSLLFILVSIFSFFSAGCKKKSIVSDSTLPYSTIVPQIIKLDLPSENDKPGGIVVADVDNNNKKDFIITKPNHIAVYSDSGKKLWTKKIDIQVTGKSESQGLPGLHGSGIQVADIDQDTKTEILYLTKDGSLKIVTGNTGEIKQSIRLQSPENTKRWEHLVIANFRGKGDLDLLLQTTNAKGYRMGSYLAAYAIEDLLKQENPQPLWTRNDFVANAHNGARIADLNRDGKDEVLGGTIISPEGEILIKIPLKGHIDSLFVADVRPDIPGLEVVVLEEGGGTRIFDKRISGGNQIYLYNSDRVIWETNYKNQEPQNAAVGDFDPKRPGLEIWCRSRYDKHQKPFIFDAQGELIAKYKMDDVAPKGWTNKGVEVIFPIHWTGEAKQLAAAKERHQSGDIGIFDPISGEFLYKFQEKADRLYVADVSGDWREELIIVNGNKINIYSNPDSNPNPNYASLWTQDHYRRSKMTWNYYSP